ncbi:uncharacterized protein LOC122069578 [Macadamia integrifolia]|uniref:uncharacterized protein LOC122069578 n=1 Tax=Macadamia integrifolia TaxID=60698 RepID=UPI001C4FD20B|nr:uncharacterized protein LOC122069578 [Macadamia integrifolia]
MMITDSNSCIYHVCHENFGNMIAEAVLSKTSAFRQKIRAPWKISQTDFNPVLELGVEPDGGCLNWIWYPVSRESLLFIRCKGEEQQINIAGATVNAWWFRPQVTICECDTSGGEMLSTSLKTSMRLKLRNKWRKNGEGGESGSSGDESPAKGWRDTLKGIMEWLALMVHDTVRRQAERNFERQNFEGKPSRCLMRTATASSLPKSCRRSS